MNEVHTRQWIDTAEVEGIAQGVIQRESQYMGREKKIPLGQCRCSRVSQMPLLPSASRPHSLTLRVGRPSLYAPLHLILCEPCLDMFAYAIPIVRKDVKNLSVRRSTSGSQRTLELHP
jgi:hypothetical protein